MKILVLSNNYSGLFRFRKEVIQAIVEEGFEVFISAPYDDKAEFFKGIGCQLINTVFNRKGQNPLKDFSLMLFYNRVMRLVRPDVVLSYTIKPNIYGGMACRLRHVPQIANITGLGTAVENPGQLQKLTTALYRIGLNKAEMVFFQNEFNLFFFLKHKMVVGNHRIIPGSGVNLEWHNPQAYPPDGPMRFIYVGRVMKEKGIDLYIDAARFIVSKYPGTEFYVMGRCENYYKSTLELLNASGIIKYVGLQDDVRPFIGMCHCTIHPSYYPEGMSNVLLESCAACRPIITTNRPGCKETVEDSVTGFLIKQKDSLDLINKIELFIRLPYEEKVRMGIAGRRRMEKLFDRRIVVESYLDVINSICNV